MTVTETLPTTVRCIRCKSTFVVPYGPPALKRYWAEQAAEWSNDHGCGENR